MVAGVVERCYEGGGGGDQEQALLRRACVFPENLAACCYQSRTLRSRKAIGGPLGRQPITRVQIYRTTLFTKVPLLYYTSYFRLHSGPFLIYPYYKA